ncbi:hypothetical protein J7E93_13240 [Streptomyces sp. ISL-36]|uniref:hypothetical protein n=1 Tax=Streptomyces sp. ISL-36 TaxID=2819182 RepID=UPI001BE515D2|nr:hypothetical protein [Streptomyces sp. ISL-36]MBT2441055.1 hypothetical protein [Streptomyces sp. ISL-36]
MAYPLNQVLAAPAEAANHLLHASTVYGVEQAIGRTGPGGSALLELTLRPLPALERENYPVERVRVVIRPDHTVHAFPLVSANRAFKHRNPPPLQDLCLQYPSDDAALRWIPEDGLEPLVTLVHRHLLYEEAWRRTGTWPAEDAPHGQPAHGSHPLRTPETEQEARRWARHPSPHPQRRPQQ